MKKKRLEYKAEIRNEKHKKVETYSKEKDGFKEETAYRDRE